MASTAYRSLGDRGWPMTTIRTCHASGNVAEPGAAAAGAVVPEELVSASGATVADPFTWRRFRTAQPESEPPFVLVPQTPRLPPRHPVHGPTDDRSDGAIRVSAESMSICAGPVSPPRPSRARPKIRIISRPRRPKSARALPAITVEPGPDTRPKQQARALYPQGQPPSQGQRRVKRRGLSIAVRPLVREVWGQFPTPLDHKRLVPRSVSEWLITYHRWFKPQLVHQTLYNTDGRFEPALQYVYQTWMNAAQMRLLYADILEYIADVSDDVFGIDPDRYLKVRPGQVIQLENPSGSPVFIHQGPVMDTNLSSEPATVSVYADTATKPSQLKLVLNDAALFLWGYTKEQWESHQVHDVEDPSIQDKIIPFFFSMFSPATLFTILALNLGVFYLQCKFASFRCSIMRRDGKLVPMLCTFTTYLHARHAHVSQFVFTDSWSCDPGHSHALAANSMFDDRELPDLELPVLLNLSR